MLAFARRVKTLDPADASRSALVYTRPLPYLYAAQQVLQSAGVPFQSSAALPLAAEPGAASLDLLMDVALSGDTRAALIVLLRSPHVQVLRSDGTVVDAAATAALDRWLAEQRYLGTLDHKAIANSDKSISPIRARRAVPRRKPGSRRSLQLDPGFRRGTEAGYP